MSCGFLLSIIRRCVINIIIVKQHLNGKRYLKFMKPLKSIIVVFVLLISYSHTDEVVTESNKFSDVLESAAFVDKTLLLKEIFNYGYMLITAPSGFMKSTNLDMMKCFLSQINASDSYKLFTNTNIYKQERQFFDDNFGKYPILYIDLKPDKPMTKYRDVVNTVRDRVHDSFVAHGYLLNSSKLTAEEKDMYMFCYDRHYRRVKEGYLMNGLQDLVRYLYNHYNGTRVVVLIDGYDTLLTKAMFNVNVRQLRTIVQMVIGQIFSLINSNVHVGRVVVTGVTVSPFLNVYRIDRFQFLHRHAFVDFYGFTKDEVENLFRKSAVFQLNASDIQKANQWYEGYTTVAEDRRVYNPISILNFLKHGTVDNYWQESEFVDRFKAVFRHNSIRRRIEQDLLQNKRVFVAPRKPVDIMNVRLSFEKAGNNTGVDYAVIFAHLVERGYLSYAGDHKPPNTISVRIPNNEMWCCFFEALKTYFINERNVDATAFTNASRSNFQDWFKGFSSHLT